MLLVSVESGFAFAHSILGIKGPVGTLNVTTIASVIRILLAGDLSRVCVVRKSPATASSTASIIDIYRKVVAHFVGLGSFIEFALDS